MRAASFGEGTGARADVTLLWGQRAVLRAARGSRGECAVATVRTGVAWSSFACWLVILIRAGSSEVGARSHGADVGIALVCMSSLTCRTRSQEVSPLGEGHLRTAFSGGSGASHGYVGRGEAGRTGIREAQASRRQALVGGRH